MDFATQYKQQPDHVKQFLNAHETSEIIKTIGDTFGISNEHRRAFSRKIGEVIIGMISLEDFKTSLVSDIDVSEEAAQNIAQEVDVKIISQSKIQQQSQEISENMSAVDKVLAGSQWRGKVQEISERYMIKDAQTLEEIVEKAARANNHDISDTIARSLGITNEKSAKIADALRQKVLIPIEQYVSKQTEPEPAVPEIAPKESFHETEEEYETKPEEHSERLNRLQILNDIENPLGKRESKETGKPAAPTAEESAKLAGTIPQKPKEVVAEKPAPTPPVVPPKPAPTPEPKPEAPKPAPAPTQAPTKPDQKSRPSDGGDLLSTIQQAQEKHGNIVDRNMNTPQTSKTPEKPEPAAPQSSANGYGSSDPYREPIE